ncbi:MAG: S1 RNA-binding domain-containing protein [Symbiobacteriia bacterium]
MPMEVGSVVEGVVTGITHFGAFIQLPDGKTGLVHISEIADTFVRDIKEFLKEQDRVKVKVLTLDDHGKVGLSIKQADPTWTGHQPQPRGPRGPRRFSESFEDKVTRFVKDSDERQSQLRRATDSKRGGRGSGRRL